MAAYGKKKRQGDASAFRKLKADLRAGTIGCAYIFYGEESYQREHYLKSLQKKLIPDGFETFNFHALEGANLTVKALSDMAEAMPMMTERTLITVTDYDIFKQPKDQQEKLTAFLEDLPPYCCVVFVYDTLEYKPNGNQRKLCKALESHVQAVEFRREEGAALVEWIGRHFRALGKDIDRRTAEHLIFTCGGLMTGLAQEIQKIGAYAQGPVITKADIDAVAAPVLSAGVFNLTSAVTQGDYDKAASILGELLNMQADPINILSVLGLELRRIWQAKVALDTGRSQAWLMDLLDIRYESIAGKLLAAARRTSAEWCAEAVKSCQALDRRLKSERGVDGEAELKLLLMQLGAKA